MIPPSGDPIRRARLSAIARAAFAAGSSSSSTTRTSNAALAGLLTRVSTPWATVTTNAGHVRSAVTASSGSRATAWATFVADDRAPQVPAVDEVAGERAEQGGRGELGDEQQGGRDPGAGLGQHVDGQGDHQQPVAGVVDQPAGPDEPEVAVAATGRSSSTTAVRRRARGTPAASRGRRGRRPAASARVTARYGRTTASTRCDDVAQLGGVDEQPVRRQLGRRPATRRRARRRRR